MINSVKTLNISWVGLLLILLSILPQAEAAVGCSPYKGQVVINEVRIGASGKSSTSNQIELFNLANVSPSVWQQWQLVVYYKNSGRKASKKGGYFLKNGFTANGDFIYNDNQRIYLTNRNNRYLDIALVDQNGNFIDYVAIEGKIQSVPTCLGAISVVNANSSKNSAGDIALIPDAGSWSTSVNNGSFHTIGRTNVCTSSGSDLAVSNSVDIANSLVSSTQVTFSVTVTNMSCSNQINSITLTDSNISTTNFTGLSSLVTQGSRSQGSSSLIWTIGNLAAGASATLTISGTPKNVGPLTTTASITAPTSGLVNRGDDSDIAIIAVKDFNYVGFDQATDEVTEGTDDSYSANISADVEPSKSITINYTVTGTTSSTDTDLPVSGSVVIDPSNADTPDSTSIDFNILDDTFYENNKTIILTLIGISSADNSVRLDPANNTMTITLIDDDTGQLQAEYHMDETGWNGGSGEVKDSSRFNRNGTAGGKSGGATTDWNSPAKAGNPGTCAYGSFNGCTTQQTVDVGAIDLGLAGQSGMAVSAWVRWTIDPATGNPWANIVSNNASGAADVGQFWLQHNSANNSFEFAVNTNSARSYVFSTTPPVQNQWYHLVGVYNGDKLMIYVNGSLENSVSLSGNIVPFANYPLTIGRWSFNSNNYRAFQGNIDEVKIYNGPLTQADVSSLYNQTHGCPAYSNGVVPNSFNCVEVGAAPNSNLYTKLASNAFNLDVVAIKANGLVETGYVSTTDKNIKLELVEGSGATDCVSRSPLSAELSKTVTFKLSDNGRKTVVFTPSYVAYANVRCRITDINQATTKTACSNDNFAIRPADLIVTTNMNADSAGLSVSAAPVIKTGAPFNMIATSDVVGYAGMPKLDKNQVLAHSGAKQSGQLSGNFNNANPATGEASNSNFSYSEVGYFSLDAYGVYDDNFASVDSASGDCTSDFSNTLVAGKYGCKFGNIAQTSYFGRFIPDHLQAQVLSNGRFAHSCSSFSYNGQIIRYSNSNHPMLNIFAYNASTPAGLTKNYTGAFARLKPSQFAYTAPTTDALQKGVDNTNLVKVTTTLATPSLTDNTNGNLTLVLGDDAFTYQRESNALIAPFNNALNITVNSVIDSDGVAASNLPIVLQPAGENIRYGRINLMNAYGSELVDLSVPLQTEYFNGKSFVTNADDRCSVASISIADLDTGDTLLPADSCIWDDAGLSGSYKCTSAAPLGNSFLQGTSSGFTGSFNLNLKAPGKTGSLAINAAVAAWLQFNWQGSGNVNPAAVASFGLYKGNSKQIYLREVY